MTGCVRFLQRNGFALVCMVVAVAACWAIELTPGSYAEWGRRRDGVKEAAEKAKEGELAPLLQWLVLELADPLPEDLPAAHSNFTLSEQIQLRVVRGLVEPHDPAQLRYAYQVAQDFEKHIALALGLAGIASLDEHEPGQEVLDRCLALLEEDPKDFIRARAAEALAAIGRAHPELIPQLEQPLRKALRDPAWRPNAAPTAGPGARKYYPVRGKARLALLRLGFKLAPGEGLEYSD